MSILLKPSTRLKNNQTDKIIKILKWLDTIPSEKPDRFKDSESTFWLNFEKPYGFILVEYDLETYSLLSASDDRELTSTEVDEKLNAVLGQIRRNEHIERIEPERKMNGVVKSVTTVSKLTDKDQKRLQELADSKNYRIPSKALINLRNANQTILASEMLSGQTYEQQFEFVQRMELLVREAREILNQTARKREIDLSNEYSLIHQNHEGKLLRTRSSKPKAPKAPKFTAEEKLASKLGVTADLMAEFQALIGKKGKVLSTQTAETSYSPENPDIPASQRSEQKEN